MLLCCMQLVSNSSERQAMLAEVVGRLKSAARYGLRLEVHRTWMGTQVSFSTVHLMLVGLLADRYFP